MKWTINIVGDVVHLHQDGVEVGQYPLKMTRRGRVGLRHNGMWLIFEMPR